jgi:hypothetical protein
MMQVRFDQSGFLASPGVRNLPSSWVIRMSLVIIGLGETTRKGQPACSAYSAMRSSARRPQASQNRIPARLATTGP